VSAAAPRAVFDTNVLLDFWVFDNARAAPLRGALEAGRVIALRSGPQVDELSDVLGRVRLGIEAERRCDILRYWDRLAVPVERVFSAPLACRDPKDQMLLDLAATARADWLVTRDKALLSLRRRARQAGFAVLEAEEAIGELDGAER
jgi:putative PIN family toxin of toxin-antitoxin system